MKVLGIHTGHDSSAALVIDGRIVADVAEERFTRIKHYNGLPIHAIAYCLESQSLTMEDIDAVAVPTKFGEPHLNFLLNLTDGRRERQPNAGRFLLELALTTMKKTTSKAPLYLQNFPVRPSA